MHRQRASLIKQIKKRPKRGQRADDDGKHHHPHQFPAVYPRAFGEFETFQLIRHRMRDIESVQPIIERDYRQVAGADKARPESNCH